MKNKKRNQIIGVIIMASILITGVVVGLSGSVAVSGSVVLESENGLGVIVETDSESDMILDGPPPGDDRVDVIHEDGEMTISGDGNAARVIPSELEGDTTRIDDIQANGLILFDPADKNPVGIGEEGSDNAISPDDMEWTDIEIGDNETGVTISGLTFEDEIPLRIGGIEPGQGVVFVNENGEVLGSDVANSEGFVSDDMDVNGEDLFITLEEAPSTLEIRDENTGEIIDDEGEVEIRFFRDDNQEVITRTAEDGSILLDGLPVDERLYVDADAEGYIPRNIIIDSAAEQQNLFLLNESTTSLVTDFRIEDRTGNFDDPDTELIIERPIEINEETRFRAISGDQFGSAQEFSTFLAADDRYRLRVVSNEGEIRSIGDYTANTEGVKTLEIGEVKFEAPDDRGFGFTAQALQLSDEGSGDTRTLRTRYFDTYGNTSNVEWELRYEANGTIAEGPFELGPVQQYQETLEIDAGTRYEVHYEVNREGETIEETIPVGGLGTISTPIPSHWIQTLSLVSIVALAGLFGGSLSRIGGVVVVSAAWGLSLIGLLTIPYVSLSLAGVAAILFAFGGPGGVR